MTSATFGFAGQRRAKDADTVALIEHCARIADDAVAEVLSSGLEGKSERQIGTELDARMFALGAEEVSFPTIVATGPNGAEPHHEPGDRIVRSGDAVVIDIGAAVSGYRSDMTRTFLVGDPRPEMLEMWAIVHEAQTAGLGEVCAGNSAIAVDAAVRRVFEAHGVLHEYLHLTGHGVGLVIHEHPIFGPKCGAVLQEGEVVTVEPGLYRVGTGGVRIEDLVVVTQSGCRILTKTPKELSCPPSAQTT
mgnify:CR=1 FL=1